MQCVLQGVYKTDTPVTDDYFTKNTSQGENTAWTSYRKKHGAILKVHVLPIQICRRLYMDCTIRDITYDLSRHLSLNLSVWYLDRSVEVDFL